MLFAEHGLIFTFIILVFFLAYHHVVQVLELTFHQLEAALSFELVSHLGGQRINDFVDLAHQVLLNFLSQSIFASAINGARLVKL